MTEQELVDYMWKKIDEQDIKMINDPRNVEAEAIELGSKEKIDERIKERYTFLQTLFDGFNHD